HAAPQRAVLEGRDRASQREDHPEARLLGRVPAARVDEAVEPGPALERLVDGRAAVVVEAEREDAAHVLETALRRVALDRAPPGVLLGTEEHPPRLELREELVPRVERVDRSGFGLVEV